MTIIDDATIGFLNNFPEISIALLKRNFNSYISSCYLHKIYGTKNNKLIRLIPEDENDWHAIYALWVGYALSIPETEDTYESLAAELLAIQKRYLENNIVPNINLLSAKISELEPTGNWLILNRLRSIKNAYESMVLGFDLSETS